MRHVFTLIPFQPDEAGEDLRCQERIDTWMTKHQALIQDGVRLIQDQHEPNKWFVYLSAMTKDQFIAQSATRLAVQEVTAKAEIQLQQRLQGGVVAPAGVRLGRG